MKYRGLAIVLSIGALAACASPEPVRPPIPVGGTDPELPEIPRRTDALELDLVYPEADGRIAVRDSTFVFGSTGTGRAKLTINGHPIEVQPNGAFLAFLPVPDDGVYRLLAATTREVNTLTRKVQVPADLPTPPADSAYILAGSVFPNGAWAVPPGERIEVGFRGTPGGEAWLVFSDGERVPLVEAVDETEDESAAASSYRGYFLARPILAMDTAVAWPRLAGVPPAPEERARLYDGPLTPLPLRMTAAAAAGALEQTDTAELGDRAVAPFGAGAAFELVAAGDTVRVPLPLNLTVTDPDRPWVGVGMLSAPRPQTAGVVRGNAGPGTTWIYFWPPGVRLTLVGERNGEYRVRLAPTRTAWVDADEVMVLPPGLPPADARVGWVTVEPYAEAVDVRLPTDERVPFTIETGERSLEVTLYGATGNTGRILYGALDPFVERIEWDQPSDDIYTLRLSLSDWPWGYRAFYAEDGDLVVRVRRPPVVQPRHPLRGITVAVDAGHPPGGATGPTGLTEAEAVLAIALELADMLEDEGANVVLTRSDMEPVGLYERVEIAENANADLFVSIHLDAFPDGVNPWQNNGTGVYYYHPFAAGFAASVERELLDEFELRNLGIARASLALPRNATWMPSILTETMFMMIPRQEAALRDERVIRRIARAHLEGIREFLEARAVDEEP